MPLNFVAKAAISVGLTLANMALTATRKIEGPRLDNLKFTSGDYGAALQMTWGVRRHECPIFWAEDLREVKRRRKTKGGKFNDYTYYGTWAVALAGHEIGGATRIWFDTHLVYDTTGAGPVTPFDFGGVGAVSDFITIYLGTDTQDPDPRMQATIEAEFGEGSCPAYRDTAYIVFKDVPLEKLGNRIPQVSVEVVSSSTPVYPYETHAVATAPPRRMWGATFSTDFARFMWSGDGEVYEIWDVAARALMVSGTFSEAFSLQSTFGMYADGRFLAVGDRFPASGNQLIYRVDADGQFVESFFDLGDVAVAETVRVIADGNGTEHWMTTPWSTLDTFYVDGIEYEFAWAPSSYFPDASGNIWAVGRAQVLGTTTAYFYRVVTVDSDLPALITVTGLAANNQTLYACSACHCLANDTFVLAWGQSSGAYLYAIDPVTSAVTDSLAIALDPYNTEKQFDNLAPGAASLWLDEREIDLSTLTVLRTIDVSDWIAAGADGFMYDPVNHALWTAPPAPDNEINILFLDRQSGDGVPLSTICGDVADWCGIEDHDFSALDQTVRGWSATQGQASNIVDPLLTAYDSDIRPHDFTVQGIKRSGVSGGTILTERFVRGEPRYTAKVRQSSELPRAVLVTFADVNADQQPFTVRADRPLDATDARGERTIDMGTWASDGDEARQIAERFMRRIWNERREVSCALTAQHYALEPGDCRTLDLDGEAEIYRCTRLTVRASGELATEWVYDAPTLATLNGATGATFDGRNDSEIAVPLLSKGFILDVPLLNDADASSNPLLYVLAAPYSDGTWPGAVIYEAVDGEYTEEAASILSSAPATWGSVAEVLPYTNPNVWDRGSSITVTLQTGELTGATEAALDANARLNMAAIGATGRWEIVQFTTATLIGTKTYTVSGFKRGRRGTEWAAELHAAGDAFVLLDTAEEAEMGLSEVGTNETFKAVTNGRTESGAFPVALAPFTGASLKPYAPCHLNAVKESNGDWTLSWVRRTRVGGAWTSGTSVPLSEASEEYELTVGDGVDESVITVTSATSYTWTLAAQTTLTGGEVITGDLVWSVNQQSDAVGDGFLAEATA